MSAANTTMYEVGGINRPPTPFKRNLGSAIVEVAIHDYRSTSEMLHWHAREFLYPQTLEARNHFSWVVALAPGVNERWLRDMLDRKRDGWDKRRQRRLRRRAQ